MEIVESERQFGPIGAAKVATVGKVLQIIMAANGEIINLSTDELPEGVKKVPSGEYKVSVSHKKDKLYELYPLNGSQEVEFIGIAKKQGQPPFPRAPYNTTGKNRTGGEYTKDWLEWKVLNRIVSGPHKGLIISFKLRYYFTVGKDGTHAAVSGTGKYALLVSRFLDSVTGDIGKVRVVYSDNILPALETLLLREGRPYQVIVENGWVNTIAGTIGNKRKPAAKKAAKKSAKRK